MGGSNAAGTLVGVISDTHGLVRESALAALSGCELIVHAGDIGMPGVIESLEGIAPVIAVRGNVDHGDWAGRFAETEVVAVRGRHLYVIHDIGALDIDPKGVFAGVVYGHSHKPVNEWRDDVLYFNPGSAGPRRFKLPIAVGRMRITDDAVHAEVIELDD